MSNHVKKMDHSREFGQKKKLPTFLGPIRRSRNCNFELHCDLLLTHERPALGLILLHHERIQTKKKKKPGDTRGKER
jgi:hypothetical protein